MRAVLFLTILLFLYPQRNSECIDVGDELATVFTIQLGESKSRVFLP